VTTVTEPISRYSRAAIAGHRSVTKILDGRAMVAAGVGVPPEPFRGGATQDSVMCEKGRYIMSLRVK
jgi:hypothetical protein